MKQSLRDQVLKRAGNRCEYCHVHQDQDSFYTFPIGLTAIGRTTVELLAINHPDYVFLREALIAEGAFPPESDLT